MLQHLLIRNYTLIEHLELSPSPNLNIITGETGAGKSIMLGAIGLLLGDRADTKTLYDISQKCIIEGTFNISAYNLHRFFDTEALDYEEKTIIRREITPSGKSRAFINDTPVRLEQLKQLGIFLMDIHSQHDTLLMSKQDYQLFLIDTFATHQELLNKYHTLFKEYKALEKQCNKLEAEVAKSQKEEDYNQFLLEELDKASLEVNEQEKLEEELQIQENAENIKVQLSHALNLLSYTEQYNIQNILREVQQSIRQIEGLSKNYENIYKRISDIYFELDDIVKELEHEVNIIEVDPGVLSEIQERLSIIYSLQKKHQVQNIKELIEIQAHLEKEAYDSQSVVERLQEVKVEKENVYKEVLSLAKELSNSRKKILLQIPEKIAPILQALGMPNAQVSIEQKIIDITDSGMDQIEILFSANKGIKPQSIRKVASGGEFSRLMFAIKYLLAEKTALPTIIFDEIDTGISGEVALMMGKMMKRMTQHHQIISITHLPQIAAKGDCHFFVFKDSSATKAVSRVKVLEADERALSIAKMIGGDSPSDTAIQNAKEMLAEASS